MIALSIEKNQLTAKNIFYVILMYFTYSQLWLVLVMVSLILELRRIIKKEDSKWYKTERFVVKERGKDT